MKKRENFIPIIMSAVALVVSLILTIFLSISTGDLLQDVKNLADKVENVQELSLEKCSSAYLYAGQIKELQELYAEGILTEEEANNKLNDVVTLANNSLVSTSQFDSPVITLTYVDGSDVTDIDDKFEVAYNELINFVKNFIED